ncbi:hypothetical protein LAZ67_23002033, partial [Cordylochernes scorpioides]
MFQRKGPRTEPCGQPLETRLVTVRPFTDSLTEETVSGAVVTPILYTPASSPKGQVPTPEKNLSLGDKSPEMSGKSAKLERIANPVDYRNIICGLRSLRKISESYDCSRSSDDTSEPADDALASGPDSSKGKAQGSQEVPEIAVEDSDEKSAVEDSQPSGPLDVESSGVGASSDVEEDTGRNEPSPASITFKALETTDSKEIDLTILGNIAREHCAQGITFEQSNVIRTLGLGWIQGEDCFLYEVQSLEKTSATTTSEMLSFIAKLEDPLRWLAPVLVTGKIMVQKLWITELHWDDPMDESLTEAWTNIGKELNFLGRMRIPDGRNEKFDHFRINEAHGQDLWLTPILDDQGILGVGGRLKWAPSMTYEQKHPAPLPSLGKVAQMIIQAVHMRTLHGSVHLMLFTMRQKYWMLRAKDQVKRCIRECVTCCRYNRVTPGQLMSDLPKERLTPGKPFSISGVDCAGPVNLRMSKGRGRKTEKGYICLVVCYVTRAVHLELFPDASTPTIMTAFKRVVARRGHCTRLYSDEGTSFVGAARQVTFNNRPSRLMLAQNLKDPTGRLARWALKIQEYDFDIIHKSGKKHLDADGLSRGPLPETDWDEDFERLFLNQITDEEDKFIESVKKSLNGSRRSIAQNFKEEDGCLFKKNPNPEGRAWLLVVPEKKKREIMKEYHNHMSNGHLGVARTMYRIKSKYFWPSMLKDVSEFVKACHLCQSRKGSNQLPSGLLQPIPPANFPFERIGIDFVGPLPSTKNRKKWIIVLPDYYTRYAETRAVSEATVKEVSKFLVEDIFLRHGAPQYLISDRGSQFTSNLMKEVMKTCKIKHCFTTSYHPQTNGLTERLNRTLINMLSMYVNTDQKNWDEILPFITHAYNTTIQETTGYSPFFLMFGREPTSLLDDRNISVDINKDDYDEYIKHHLDKINRTRKLVINNTIKTQERMKKNYDKKHMERSYEPGELVAVWTPIRKIGKCEKLLRKYFGPYRILKKLSNVNYLIEPKDNPGQDPLIVHVSRIKPYFDRIDEVNHEDDCRNLRLFVTDKNTGLRFLVDSGADISIIPPKDKNRMPSSDYKLYAANGTEIVTYGTKVRNLDIGLRRQFQWPFVIANTNRAIIGADFLNNFGLIIDIKNKRLIDGITNLSIRGVIQSISDMGNISTLNSSSKVSAILTKYPNLCRPPSDFVEAKHSVKHYIPTRGQPIHSKARRLDSQRLTFAKAEFQYMLNNGIIRPSNSPWASPLHLVSKKDESLRPCGDYRRLNAVTLPDRYPIPRLDDFHHILKDTRVYSKIDLCKAFYQIPIAEEDKPKTAIITPFGLFEFNVMSFGLRNATATFQRFMHEVLRNLDFAFVYLDDILVASKTEEEHYSHLETLFSRLNSYGLRINLSKSKFLVQEIDFLGYLITSHGVKPLPTKVKAILEYKKPKTVHELRIFLGMLNFYRTFLNNAAETQAILHEYLRGAKKKDRSEIKWTKEAEVQFEKCKQALANTALLAYPDTELPISLCTDASDRAVGSVLQQLDNNNWKPIAFFSKKLNPAQCNYSTYDRELLAIYLSIKFFKHLLEAREFTILTDHKPLIYAFKQKNEKASPRQLRHLQYISQFSTDIKYIKGTDNIVADALSRVVAITTIDYEEIAKEQTGDSELQNLISKNTSLKFIHTYLHTLWMVETRSGKMQDPAQERIQAEESAKPQPGATIGRDASSDPVVLNPNIDIPKYDGTEDPRPWIESLEEIGFLYHWADYIISRYAAMNMTGSAKTWLNLHKASFTSWENIKIRLIQDFSLDANKEELRMKLNRMQHWNEPAIRFAEDILVLCNKVDPAMEEETKIEHVIGGLKKEYSFALYLNPPKTTDDLLVMCKKMDYFEKKYRERVEKSRNLYNGPRYSRPQQQSRYVPPTAARNYQTTSRPQAPVSNNYKNDSPPTPRQYRNNFPQPSTPRRPYNPNFVPKPNLQRNTYNKSQEVSKNRTEDGRPICFKCNKPGHVARYCRVKFIRILEEDPADTQEKIFRVGRFKLSVAPESVNQSKSTINGIKKLDPKYKLKINVDKIGTFEALVDTGADLSVVDLRTALDTGHGISKLAKICAGPDGKKLDMVGSIFLNIKIDDETLSHNFVILKTHLRTLILGRDFLKKMNAKIDCKQETIKYDLTNNHDEINFEILKIKSAKDSIVPECSMKLIKALVETEDGEYIIEESSKMFQTNGLRLARSLINVINRETHIWITNPYPRPLKIMKNQTLAFGSSPAKINVSREREVEKNEEPRFQINENLSPKEQKELKQVLERYGDLFSSRLGRTNLAKHRIDTEDAKPIKNKPYRVSAKERDIIKEQIDEMLTEGIIRPSSSPWSFPVILVKKRDGKYRFCVDYRKLNNVTVKDVYPIPRIDEVMDTLQGSTHFSAIDLRSGYWQVEVEERDKEKTAFTTAHGLYEFNVMPFGLCNAPATFERNMENMLGNLRWQICLCYLDDVIIYSPDFPTHLKRLEAVFRCFRESNLRLNDKKCRFAFEELEILGYITSKHGIKPAEHNIKAVRNFPRPKKVKEVQSFLGMCSYYRKFIKDFSKIADPLTNLIKKSVSFTWTERQEEAFQTLKTALLSPPILGHFNPNAPTYVHTDASNIGIGATLVQDIGGEEKVISYLSRTLSKAEQNYSTTEKECLAVVWSMSKLRPYLYGRHFKIVTDHHALCWLKNLKDPTGRLARWALKIQEYDFDIIHKSGKKHLDADGLSRGPLPETDWDEDFERLFLNQITDEEDKFIESVKKNLNGSRRSIAQNFKEEDGCLFKKNPNPEGRAWLLVVPENKKREIMKEYHNHMSNGHLGVARTMYRIKSKYFWPSMLKDVSEFVKTCHLCQSRKGSNQLPSGLLQPIPPANFPFERIGIDFVGPLPSTKNRKKWIIVLSDYYTRYAETRAVSEATVKEVSKFLVEDIFLRHGAPQYLISDRGSQFTSNLMKEVMKTCKIKHCFTTSYHPQTNGLTERLNRTLINMLSMYVNTDQKNWDEILPFITHAYNTTIQETTGYSPFFLMFGREPTSLLDDRNISVDIDKDDYDEYIKHHLDKINRTRKLVINNTIKTQERMKKNYDKKHMERSYEPGELVAVWTPIRKIGKCEKLLRKYFGPYRILKKLSNVNYLIEPKDNPGQDPLIVHVSRIKPYFERIDEVNHED